MSQIPVLLSKNPFVHMHFVSFIPDVEFNGHGRHGRSASAMFIQRVRKIVGENSTFCCETIIELYDIICKDIIQLKLDAVPIALVFSLVLLRSVVTLFSSKFNTRILKLDESAM